MDGQSDFGEYWDDMASWCSGHRAGVVLDPETVLLSYYGGPHDRCLGARAGLTRILLFLYAPLLLH